MLRLLKVSIFPATLLSLTATAAHAQDLSVGVDAEASTEEGVSAEAEAEAEEEAPAPEPMAEEPGVEAPAMEAPAEEEGGALSFNVFADAYFALQTQKMATPVPFHRAYVGNDPAFGAESGFSLSFAGIDASYDVGEAAATVSFRAGPSVPIFYGGDGGAAGIDNITQAYGTWRPTDGISLDLGQFGTIFGAEVAESWNNLNYTRGGLYYAMQPFWHTGLRAGIGLSDSSSLTFMVVNGVNNISEHW